MQPKTARTLAQALIDQYADLSGWTVELSSRAARTLGLCVYSRKVIRLSQRFIELNDVPPVIEAVRHEIAHARVGPGHGHDAVWKRMAVLVGAKPVRCARDAVLPPGRWSAVCPTCSQVFFRYRRPAPARRYWCRTCGPQRGLLHFATQLVFPSVPGHESNVSGR
jgi:predicted SprT family Zn-dependent metalloprotease